MSRESQHIPPVFQIDVSASGPKEKSDESSDGNAITGLLTTLAAGQERQNQLLEKLVDHLTASQKQRSNEFKRWRDANPDLATECRSAAESLSRVQASFLEDLAEEARENEDAMVDGGFMMTEFVDRFGPRLAHLNGVLQVLSQLGGAADSQ